MSEINVNITINESSDALVNSFDLINNYYKSIRNYDALFDYNKILFLKGLLVTSDHIGSAHKKIQNIDMDVKKYYCDKFQIPFINTFRSTQSQCIESKGESSILKAPTGTGKTEAAFLWVNENLKKNHFSRIFYILPYTASINAMYSRITNDQFSQEKVDILHGKNTAYYFSLLTQKINEEQIEENIDQINSEIRVRKSLSKTFVAPIKICTPHQIIKNFYGLKHFEEAYLQYRNGLFIFDEIHCYDRYFLAEMMACMNKITTDLNGKFLFMSATFPSILKDLIKSTMDIEQSIIEFEPEELDEYTRTRLNLIDGLIEDSFKIIQADVNAGKRVLIVCNTIQKAQVIFNKIDSNSKVLLHSAFNTNDRKRIEDQVINGESSQNKLQVLIGTQAIEVSLDLDYDCCYTEIASIDALIQRFGRVYRNRKRLKDDYGIVNVFNASDQFTDLIYNEEINNENFDIIGKTRSALVKLDGCPLDYESLCQSVDEVYNQDYKISLEEQIKVKIENYSKNQLIPMKDYSDEAKIYFEQFDGVKILPSRFYTDYENYLKNKQYIDADNLLVSLSERKLFSYYRQNFVNKIQIGNKEIFVAEDDYLKYDDCLGLCSANPNSCAMIGA